VLWLTATVCGPCTSTTVPHPFSLQNIYDLTDLLAFKFHGRSISDKERGKFSSEDLNDLKLFWEASGAQPTEI
jgi:hypothetical protein